MACWESEEKGGAKREAIKAHPTFYFFFLRQMASLKGAEDEVHYPLEAFCEKALIVYFFFIN